MTVREASKLLGVSASEVYHLVDRGRIPHYRPSVSGRRIVLDEADVTAYRESCRRLGSPSGEVSSTYLQNAARFSGPQPISKHDPRRHSAARGGESK
jgi:excisionase family DNA binding protein